jgi:5'(3')-deoxyribonucleotidase
MADFDAMFPSTFGLDHKSMADAAMWERINSHPSYFRDMPMCEGAAEFWDKLVYLGEPVSILTACPKSNYAHAATQKREWVREHIGDVTVLPVMGGRNKPLFMHQKCDILIDDWFKNCAAWDDAGGHSIHHQNFDETWGRLLAQFPQR